MAQNFIAVDREQVLLMPPSLREWLPEDHFAWFVLATVERLDLSAFYRAYRPDGHGRAAFDPRLMVGVLFYSYSHGLMSSRGIERACVENVAVRVVAANQKPDHATIARFRQRHQDALAGLFNGVLKLCAQAGLVNVGLIAIDGSKLSANASQECSYEYERIVRELLAEADRIDREEDEQHGESRGDELPEHLRTEEGRRAALAQARERLERELADGGSEDGEEDDSDPGSPDLEIELDAIAIVAGQNGRQGWFREARRQVERQRELAARPIRRSRAQRLLDTELRMQQNLAATVFANERYEEYRAQGRMKNGRRFGGPPKPFVPPTLPEGKINLTDPDSGSMKTLRGHMQGYNAQMATNEQQIVLAAEITVVAPDFGVLEPMVTATLGELHTAGITERPEVVVADAGYWHQAQMERVINEGIQVLIPPDAAKRASARPGWEGGYYAHMRRVLATEHGGGLYKRRQAMIEPVFAHTKFNRGINRFLRRGRSAVRAEWRLITATHNLLKLHKHPIATSGA
jgi:transposase